ncbi:MAG: hypothetical protein ACI4VQ_03460 [Clostridia bacterium]
MNNYSEKLVEVDEVLHHLSIQNFNKIPKEIVSIINESKDKNYKWFYNENLPLEQQNLSRDAIIILSWINMEYLLNPEQKDFLKQIHKENEKVSEGEKIKKYNSSNIFKKPKYEKTNINRNEISIELIKVKNKNFIQKIFDKIKNLFK